VEVEVRFDARRWVFPQAECRLLPLASTTVELVAAYLGQRLLERLSARGLPQPGRLRIELEESSGCAAVCEIGGD
jgi:6-pyruvoyltetrahydropterin/6-carboxytetrahydropterin synthase